MTLGRRAVLSALVINLMCVLPVFLTGAMAVQISTTFGVVPADIGMSVAAFALASLIGSAPLGRLVRRFGIRNSLRFSAVVATVSMIAAAASNSVVILAAALTVAGFGNAIGQPAGNALIAAQVNSARHGFAFAIKQSAIPLATTVGGLAVPIIALTVGWCYAFVISAIITIAGIALIPSDAPHTETRHESTVPRRNVPALWLLVIGLGAAVMAATGIGALGTAGGVDIGISPGAAGLIVATGGIAGLIVRLAAGWVADRVMFDSMKAAALLCVVGAVGFAVMALQTPVFYAVGLIVANAFGWGWPGLQHLSMARRFPTATAAASGIAQTGIAAGLFLGPIVLGGIATNNDWTAVWLVAAAAGFGGAIVITLASYIIPEPLTARSIRPEV